MVTPPNLIENSKRRLGFALAKGPSQSAYLTWRRTIQAEARRDPADIVTGVKHTRFRELRTLAVGYKTFPGKALLEAEKKKYPTTFEGAPCHQALEALVADTIKKIMSTESKHKKLTLAEAEAFAELGPGDQPTASGSNPDANGPQQPSQWAIRVYLRDPNLAITNDLAWNSNAIRHIKMIKSPTLENIYEIMKSAIPEGRTVREIQGALMNSEPPAAGAPSNPPADITPLRDDEEVHAWLLSTESRPIKVLITLHSTPPRPDTPVPDGGQSYFGPDKFNTYDSEPEDSSDESKATRKIPMPKADRVFLSRIRKTESKKRRIQANLEKLTAAYIRLFPDTDDNNCPIRPNPADEYAQGAWDIFMALDLPDDPHALLWGRRAVLSENCQNRFGDMDIGTYAQRVAAAVVDANEWLRDNPYAGRG